jgi:hypothetical protein
MRRSAGNVSKKSPEGSNASRRVVPRRKHVGKEQRMVSRRSGKGYSPCWFSYAGSGSSSRFLASPVSACREGAAVRFSVHAVPEIARKMVR